MSKHDAFEVWRHRRVDGATAAESSLAALVLAGLGLAIGRFLVDGYPPQPFYFRVSESLMDLYTPAFWANNGRAFETWRSLYPPLSFVILKLVSIQSCYAHGDVAARACDWLPRWILLMVFVFNGPLVYATYRRADARTALPRAVAMSLGLPMLYALERGNLLIPCFTCFALGYGDLLHRRWLRWLALAASMNFKPYLGLVALPLAIKRYWPWVVGCGALSVAVYLASWSIYGSGGPMDIIANETRYSVAPSKGYFADLYYATAYWPLIRLLHAFPPGLRLASAAVSQGWSIVLTVLLRVVQLASLGCVLLAAFRPRGIDIRRLGALVAAVSMTAFTTGSAGYAQIFLFFLVFFEPWRGAARITLLVATYLLCIPIDVVLWPVIHEPASAFLSGREVVATFGVSAGQLLRPALLLVMQCALVVINLVDILTPQDRARPDSFDSPTMSTVV